MLKAIYRIIVSGSIFGLFLEVVPITLLVGLIYMAYRLIRIKKYGLTVKRSSEIMRWLFAMYLTGLINLILLPANLWTYIWANIVVGYSHSELTFFSGEFNLVPTLFKLIMGELTIGRWVLKMLIYNFLMFVPFGFFLPFVLENVNNRKIWKIAVVVPVVVEVVQPIVGRSFDVDDLILNFAGIIVGYFGVVIFKTICKRKANRKPIGE